VYACSGCTLPSGIICTLPKDSNDIKGYDVRKCVGAVNTPTESCAVACAAGFEGTPKSVCTKRHGVFSFSGCSKSPTPAPSPSPTPLAARELGAAGACAVLLLLLVLGRVLKKIRGRRTSAASAPLLPLITDADKDDADGVDLLVFACEDACRPQVNALKELIRWEEHNFSTRKSEFGPPDAVGPVRLFIQWGVDSELFAKRLREKRPRWLHFMGHGCPSDVGPGQLSLSHGAALQPDELRNVVFSVAGRSRLDVICFSSCNVLRDGDSVGGGDVGGGGQRQWIRELAERWHVIGFKTRALATPGLVGFFKHVYTALLNDPAQVQKAFGNGWMKGVSEANDSIQGISFAVGDPAPSEDESYVLKNPSGEDGCWRVAFGIPLLLSPGEPEHAATRSDEDSTWERYPACAREGCCNMAEKNGFCGDGVCQPEHVHLGRRMRPKRLEGLL
jgi:hypothetical protein